jgi:hypothetical protein
MFSLWEESYKALVEQASVLEPSYSSASSFLSKLDLNGLVVLVLYLGLRVYLDHFWEAI